MFKHNFIHYNHNLKLLARNLRNNSTLSEVLLWKYLRQKQFLGYDFHRQKPIDNFIVDFYCSELKLAIEIDGNSHDENKYYYDINRKRIIESLGISVLVFSDYDVKFRIEEALQTIENWINSVF